MNKIMIFGSFSGYNNGDLAILQSMIRNFVKQNDKFSFIVGTKNPSLLRAIFKNSDISFYKTLTPCLGVKSLKYMQKSDILVFGGGGLFFGYKLYNPFFNHLVNLFFVTLINKLFFRKKIYLFSAGASHLHGYIVRQMTKFIINNSNIVTVRDELSYKIFKEIAKKKVSVYRDPAFLLKSLPNEKVTGYLENNLSKDKKNVVFCCNASLYKDRESSNQVINLLAELDKKYRVFLFENTNRLTTLNRLKGDLESAGIMNKSEIKIIPFNDLMPEEIIGLIGFFDISISLPMHFGIFSYLAKIPLILINYNDKVTELSKIINNELLVDFHCLDKIHTILEKIEGKTDVDFEIIESAKQNFLEFNKYLENTK